MINSKMNSKSVMNPALSQTKFHCAFPQRLRNIHLRIALIKSRLISLCVMNYFSYDSVVSTTRAEDDLSCFDYKEVCIFDTSRIKITGLIEFAVVPDPNFFYPPVKTSLTDKSKVNKDIRSQLSSYQSGSTIMIHGR